MASFGDRYKKLIDSNPNKKSIPNNDPGIVQGLNTNKNPYQDLILSGSNQKSLFNNDSGIVFANPTFKNPYKDLLYRWDWIKPTVSAPFIGRKTRTELVDIYYVVDGYVEMDYVTVEQGEVTYPYYS
jgi:hypothetical protein